MWTQRTVSAIGSMIDQDLVDAFIHVGDMAYYSAVDGGAVGALLSPF